MAITLSARTVSLVGERYGRLVADEPVELKPNGHVIYVCRCDCGKLKRVSSSNLRSGHTQSCGCLLPDVVGATNKTHGRSATPVYRAWTQMIQRCHLKTAHNYRFYGARGIKVCERWRKSFEAFIADMGERPRGGSIDRIDNDGDYDPGNCRWATKREQSLNTSIVKMIEHDGKTQSLSDWERELGFGKDVVGKRLRKGWTVERALLTPARRSSK